MEIKYIMYNVQDYRVLFARLYVGAENLLACGKHLHDRVISLRHEV
jgi:hypothetical protein